MRTTIELPDELFRQLKARAALEGRLPKDVLTEYVREGLARHPAGVGPRVRSQLPVAQPATGVPLPVLSNAEVEARMFDDPGHSEGDGDRALD